MAGVLYSTTQEGRCGQGGEGSVVVNGNKRRRQVVIQGQAGKAYGGRGQVGG